MKCSAYEGIPLIGRHVESLRQLRLNRDQPESIDHELWMDTDQPLPTLNLFCVSAVNDMTVSISVSSIIEFQIWWVLKKKLAKSQQ